MSRQLLTDLVSARQSGEVERVAALLRDDARYWDCVRGDVSGRRAAASALVAPAGTGLALETLAVADADAVLEVKVTGSGPGYRSTEVYRVEGEAVASVKVYVDPRVATPAT